MKTFLPLAIVTFREGIRNRMLVGISIFALCIFVANLVVCQMIMRDVGKVAVDIALSTVSFCGLLTVLFVGTNLIAKDFDRKTIYVVLSRPISRTQYIFGKFTGLVLLLLVTTVLLGVCALGSVYVAKWTYPNYFEDFSALHVVIALVYIFLGLVMLAAVIMFFSAVTSSSYICLIFAVISYLVGSVSSDVVELLSLKDNVGIVVSPLIEKIVLFVSYLFPNMALFDLKILAAHGVALDAGMLLWPVLYWFSYVAFMLVAASIVFRNREFP